MVLALGTVLLGAGALSLAGVGTGYFLKKGGGDGSMIGAGLVEVGTKKEFKTTSIQQTTTTHAPYETFQPVYTYAPQYQISSPYGKQTSKQDIAPVTTHQIIPTISAPVGGGGGGGDLLGDAKGLILLGGIGYLIYKVVKK